MASAEIILARALKAFTDKERTRVRNLFNTFDKDGDGSLDSVELRYGLY